MVTVRGDERGIALMVSLIGIVVVGALVSGVFASGIVEQRAAENTRWMERSFAAAEYGLTETIAQWNTGVFNQLAVGASAEVSGSSPRGTGRYSGSVRRLNRELFLVDVTGQDARLQGRQRLGAFVKLRPLNIDIQAALTTQGEPRVGGSAEIDATDQNPWADCPPPGSSAAGIRLPAANQVRFQGACAGGSCVTGTPAVLNDATVADSTFFDYGDFGWDELVTMATKVLTPGTYTGVNPTVVNGECQMNDSRNWGAPDDPTSPCYNYMPMIYVPGSMSINGNAGQGLLLVDGDLRVQGNFRFFGVVIVRGTLRTAGSGNHFNGGVLAARQSADETTILGNARLSYSSCAIGRALQAGSPGAMLRSRGWIQVY